MWSRFKEKRRSETTVPLRNWLDISALCGTLILILAGFPMFTHPGVVQASAITVQVDPHLSNFEIGQAFPINVTVLNVENLYSVEVTLTWNPSVLQGLSSDVRVGQMDGVLYGNPQTIEDNLTMGQYLLSAFSINPTPPFTGSGNIVSITFKVIGNGDTVLALESELYDYPPPDRYPRISYPIEHDTIGGAFGSSIPEFSSPVITGSAMIILAVTLAAIFKTKLAPASTKSKIRPSVQVQKDISERQNHRKRWQKQ